MVFCLLAFLHKADWPLYPEPLNPEPLNPEPLNPELVYLYPKVIKKERKRW